MTGTLKGLIDIVTANSDEAIDEFLELMNPENHEKSEMQVIYEDTLGYDPTTYFDKRDMANIADKIAEMDDIPSEVKEYIREEKDDLVDSAYEDFELQKPVFMQASLEQKIYDATDVDLDIGIVDEGGDDYDETDDEEEE